MAERVVWHVDKGLSGSRVVQSRDFLLVLATRHETNEWHSAE